MFRLLAHAGEIHTDNTESALHFLEPWYVAIPAFFLLVGIIGYLTWLVSNRNRQVTLGVVTFTLLIIGFTSFTVSAAVSVIAILLGLIFAGFSAFTSLVK